MPISSEEPILQVYASDKFLLGIILFILSLLIGYFSNKFNHLVQQHLLTTSIINCLCGGIYLSLSIVHLLPYSIFLHKLSSFKLIIPYSLPILGFGFILFIEKVFFDLQNAKHQSFPKNEISLNEDRINSPHYFSEEEMISDDNKEVKRTNSNQALLPVHNHKYTLGQMPIPQNKEIQFKKIFTQSGKFVSMTKFTFNAHTIKRQEKAKEKKIHKIGTIINKEVFDEVAFSFDDALYCPPKEINLWNHNFLITLILIFGLSIHCLIEGMCLGVIIQSEKRTIVTIAVVLRKMVETITIAHNLHQAKLDEMIYYLLLSFYSLMNPIGLFVGVIMVKFYLPMEGFITSFCVGSFLYLGSTEIIMEEFEVSKWKMWKFGAFIFGILFFSML